jgi:hypothetical protein
MATTSADLGGDRKADYARRRASNRRPVEEVRARDALA